MESKAKFLGHSVHQMLIVFPLGLLATAIIFDLIYLVTDNSTWTSVAYYMIGAGLIGGLLAAPFGYIDWRAIPANTRAKSVGLAHGAGNLVVVLLFFLSWLIRGDAPEAPTAFALVLSFAGAGLALVTAWLGGELVSRLGVGVYDDANLNASNSLSHRKTL
jgi:uncharacterized membrane protein